MATVDIEQGYIDDLKLYRKCIKNDIKLCNHSIRAIMKEIEIHRKEVELLEETRDHKVQMYEQATEELIKAKGGR